MSDDARLGDAVHQCPVHHGKVFVAGYLLGSGATAAIASTIWYLVYAP